MSETLTATDISSNCNVTNNAGVDVVVLDAYTTGAIKPAPQMYEQTLKLIKNDTQDAITAGTTGAIVLNDTHLDANGAPALNTSYNLILAQSGTFFPVKSIGVSSFSTPRDFKTVTIAADDAKNMSLAENFWQTIMAYPTSQMAQDYNDALTTTSSTATTSTQIGANVQDFFKNKTHEFTTLTLNNVLAVQTYYSQFPFVWANYKSSKTYYLYKSDGTNTTYVGSVTLNLPSSASVDKKIPDGAIMFTDALGAPKKLYYQNGQFVDDTTKDVPAVSLKGLFTIKSSLTKVETDNTIIAMLYGTANGATVMGYPDKLAPKPEDPSGKWWGLYPLLHPKNGQDWLNLLGQVLMLYMAYEIITKKTGKTEEKLADKKIEKNGVEPSPTEVEQIRNEVEIEGTAMNDFYQKLLDKFDANLKMTTDMNASIKDLQQKIEDRFNEEQRAELQDSLNKQGESLNDMAQYEVTPDMETMGDIISRDLPKLDNAKTSELADVLPGVKTDVVNMNTTIATEVQNITEAVGTEAAKELIQTKEELKASEEITENIERSASETREGKTPEEVKYEAKPEFVE